MSQPTSTINITTIITTTTIARMRRIRASVLRDEFDAAAALASSDDVTAAYFQGASATAAHAVKLARGAAHGRGAAGRFCGALAAFGVGAGATASASSSTTCDCTRAGALADPRGASAQLPLRFAAQRARRTCLCGDERVVRPTRPRCVRRRAPSDARAARACAASAAARQSAKGEAGAVLQVRLARRGAPPRGRRSTPHGRGLLPAVVAAAAARAAPRPFERRAADVLEVLPAERCTAEEGAVSAFVVHSRCVARNRRRRATAAARRPVCWLPRSLAANAVADLPTVRGLASARGAHGRASASPSSRGALPAPTLPAGPPQSSWRSGSALHPSTRRACARFLESRAQPGSSSI